MKEIELTQGYIALVDDEDYKRVNNFKWHIKRCLNTIYATGWVGRSGRKKKTSMHRYIMGLSLYNKKKIDHTDHNGLNNQKSNLKICTQFENMKNQISNKGVSRYKGVRWHKREKKWYSQIMSDNVRIHLGVFADERLAAEAYNLAAVKYHGEFAKLNEIPKEG